MKTFETVIGRYSFTSAIAALALAGATQIASASLIDVNFYSINYSPPGGTASGAAVVGTANDQWNGIDGDNGFGSVSSLINTSGSPTGVTLTYNTAGGAAVTSLAQNTQPTPSMMNDYLFNNAGGAITVSVGNLAAGTYDLYVYLASNDANSGNRSATVNANGISLPATGNAEPSFLVGQNYLLLTPTVGASGVLTITESDLPSTGNAATEVDMNGFQLQPAVAAVPEPASLLAGALMLLPFGTGALRMLRRRQTA
ncbi:MAG TPA: hypothetical protein VMR33_12490 [Candidatus Baltobacteraceae bacterium]|jgi:hypothetical protein|nr:hypothetical protein [Candidatus Baltobacteraceae bacterium]